MAKTGGKKGSGGKASAPPEAPKQSDARPSDVVGLISAKALNDLLKSDDRRKEEIDGIVGENREAIGYAKEKKRLDTAAYGLLKRFHRIKSNEKLANLWDTLSAYMDMTGVMKRIESVPKLELGGENSEGDEPEDGAAAAGKSETAGEGTTVVKGGFGSGRAAAPVH